MKYIVRDDILQHNYLVFFIDDCSLFVTPRFVNLLKNNFPG